MSRLGLIRSFSPALPSTDVQRSRRTSRTDSIRDGSCDGVNRVITDVKRANRLSLHNAPSAFAWGQSPLYRKRTEPDLDDGFL